MTVVAVDFSAKTPAATDPARLECAELLYLGEALAAKIPGATNLLTAWQTAVAALMEDDLSPWQMEAEIDRLALALRRICLGLAHAASDRALRSPLDQDLTVAPDGTAIDFGYERSIAPETLEDRCERYAPAPRGWHADHFLFSSGQAAMNTLLLALSPRGATPMNPPRIRHLGGYFETEELVAMLASHGMARELPKLGSDAADVLIVEPVFFDRAAQVHMVDVQAALHAHCASAEGCPPLVVVDTTLNGPCFELERLLPAAADCPAPPLVARLSSGLKLDQAGLELANVGIVSLYRHDSQTFAIDPVEKLKRARVLTGAGLGFDAIGTLEAPWFLDRGFARSYAEAVFENNARLAQRLTEFDGLFSQISHPSLAAEDAQAPFVLLQLHEDSPENYRRLEEVIARKAQARHIRFDKGGSFGFRGHRYEAILPEAGEITPFLRVALGARKGWSRDGVVALLSEIAQARSIVALG
ncbi:MAG TPA: hypothetical protein VHE77_08165 [Dongiaceae bacterium]|nr:hypothetical protein [Dongiaceae bacterium]